MLVSVSQEQSFQAPTFTSFSGNVSPHWALHRYFWNLGVSPQSGPLGFQECTTLSSHSTLCPPGSQWRFQLGQRTIPSKANARGFDNLNTLRRCYERMTLAFVLPFSGTLAWVQGRARREHDLASLRITFPSTPGLPQPQDKVSFIFCNLKPGSLTLEIGSWPAGLPHCSLDVVKI